MSNWTRKKWVVVTIAAIFAVIIALLIAALLLNQEITRYVESPQFRAELEKETAKGLHFPSAKFAPIHRVGRFSARTESFFANGGRKAMTDLDATEITGQFNPSGIFARRWQIDDLQIDRARVGIHIYEPKPEPSPSKPWYQVFLPDHVYLKRTWSDHVDVTWPMRGEIGGVFQTKLVVTPHGRDFEYHASSGTLKNSFMPDVTVQNIHLLITKQLIALYNLDVSSGEGTIHGEGNATTVDPKRADFSFNWSKLPVSEWLPRNWEGKFAGAASGNLHWTGNVYTMAAATIAGSAHVNGGRIRGLKFLDQIATITNHKDLAALQLDECRSNFRWREGDCELKDVVLEETRKFKIDGTISFSRRSLRGTLELGVAPEYLDWLPHPEEIFTRKSGGYLWTTVHVSGTLDDPKQDLSPRLLAAIKESPGALIQLALRSLSAWLKKQ
ncbi:MAG TPA: hypothetical protein VH170_08910 [Chthoniobacterales bacterium]|jgi:hypothetical protein|nr:hypothetical protein [Chthoniobacterales bacterium]